MGFASLWSVFSINAFFVGIAAEAYIGRIAKAWLIAPIAWFGIYGAIATTERFILADLKKDIEAANAGIRVPFDANTQSLVISRDVAADASAKVAIGPQLDPKSQSVLLSRGRAAYLVDQFDLPVAYSPDQSSSGPGHTSVRMMSPGACERLRVAKGYRTDRVITESFHYLDPRTGRSAFVRDFCNVRRPESPPLPPVLVRTEEQDQSVGPLQVRSSITTITTADGQTATLRGGTAWPLSWIPVPMFGCLPGLYCDVEFLRPFGESLHAGRDTMGDEATLAAALELKPIAPGKRDQAEMDRAAGVN